tara:strand:- start:167 stop:607 length:441 start_codon:yes stop_codon:yes gene_type:complete
MAFTIVLKSSGYGHHDEGTADAAISPGECIQLAADGKYDPAHKTKAESIKGDLLIATEDGLQGKTVTNAYASGDVVFFYIPCSGDHINVLIKSGENINISDNILVEGGGSGLFIEAAGTEAAYQLTALDSSGGVLGANTLIRCRVN